ncbi:DUF2382 domain-containing protein [Rouxiella sp. T17]|uniref:YsnF/AvaK domain-containing protein n=1 Tax=Rouxiella sp. T17 TaxID=3085684 RepID=UPI002FCCA828
MLGKSWETKCSKNLNENGAPCNIDWSDKTIEIEQTHEQPVINKTAHIKEEVVVRKDVSDRVETIKDSVCRKEVDIDQADSVVLREYGLQQMCPRAKVLYHRQCGWYSICLRTGRQKRNFS